MSDNARSLDGPGLLEAAARLIDRAVSLLNTSTSTCPTCGSERWADKDGRRDYYALSNMPERLREVAVRWKQSEPGSAQPDRGYEAGVRARQDR